MAEETSCREIQYIIVIIVPENQDYNKSTVIYTWLYTSINFLVLIIILARFMLTLRPSLQQ